MKTAQERSIGYAAILALLAEIGGAGIVGPLISVFGRDMNLSAEDCRFLAGPVIVHQNGWTDMVPKWMPAQAIAERVEIVFGQARGIVGPTEIAAVMMPATFQAALSNYFQELYLWAASTAAARHYKRPIADYWAMINTKPIADAEVIERGGRLWDNYQSLAHEIRRKVIGAAPREERRRAEASRTEASAVAVAEYGQLLLPLTATLGQRKDQR